MDNKQELAPEEPDLFKAVKFNDSIAVQQALQNGVNVNCVCIDDCSNDDITPLMQACEYGYDEIVRILLDAGANTRWRCNRHGWSAMMEACAKNRLSTVEILISHDSYLLEIENNCGWTPLHVAVRRQHAGIVRFLLDRGANVHRRRPSNLMRACERGNLDIVQLLLAADVNAEAGDRDQQTALHCAVLKGNVDIVQVMLDHRPSIVDGTSYGPDLTSLLVTACREGNLEVARLLLARGANAHATLSYGATKLMIACQRNNLDIARLLLSAGVDLEARDKRGRTALHRTAHSGELEALRELILNHNANLFAVDQDRKTPLDLLLCRDTYSPAVDVEQFLATCGNKMRHEHGSLALHVIFGAAEYSLAPLNEVRPPMRTLHVRFQLGKVTMVHFRILLQHIGMDLLRHQDDSGKLPIHLACRNHAPVDVLVLMLELDPTTLHVADHSGTLPIHECCRGGTVDHSSVRYLVEHVGGGVGTLAARNRENALPLHVLCGSTNPSFRTVHYMIKAFPESVVAQTNSGDFPFMIAACEASTASLNVVYELGRANPIVFVPRKKEVMAPSARGSRKRLKI